MLIYDVTNEESFANIPNFMKGVEEHGKENVKKILVGNKCDMNDLRVVSNDRGKMLADSYQIKFIETSAKSGENIHQAFETLAGDIINSMDFTELSPVTSVK